MYDSLPVHSARRSVFHELSEESSVDSRVVFLPAGSEAVIPHFVQHIVSDPSAIVRYPTHHGREILHTRKYLQEHM